MNARVCFCFFIRDVQSIFLPPCDEMMRGTTATQKDELDCHPCSEGLRINHDLVVILIIISVFLLLLLFLFLLSCCSHGTSNGRCGSRLGAVFGLDALPNKGKDRLGGCLCKILRVKELRGSHSVHQSSVPCITTSCVCVCVFVGLLGHC